MTPTKSAFSGVFMKLNEKKQNSGNLKFQKKLKIVFMGKLFFLVEFHFLDLSFLPQKFHLTFEKKRTGYLWP